MNIQTKPTFIEYAETYLKHNWSVIPVWGKSQPEQFKVATIRWSPYCQYRATKDILHHWFVWAGYQGIAIITGPISGIAVLDFDSEDIYKAFTQAFPQLTNTYTVKTPRGWHLYFAIPEKCRTQTRKGQGIDWQWEKRYVLAPPTEGYSIQNTQKPRLLGQRDITIIEKFINPKKRVYEENNSSIRTMTLKELQSCYSKQAINGERNDILFKSALLARDNGWSLRDTISALSDLHKYNRKPDESEILREREALATLKSAFSRPARKFDTIQQLPNTIREKLFNLKQTGTVRLIEGLRMQGYTPGTTVSSQEAWQSLAGILGRDSIIKAFNATSEKGKAIFEKISAYSNPAPQNQKNKKPAINSEKSNDHKCLMVRNSNSGKTQETGRPTQYFRLPDNVELSRILGVPLTSITDILSLDDIKSAKTTRSALHYGYIQRRPGKYSTAWLSKRLGVSKVTKNRYDKSFKNLHKVATYSSKSIYWNNLNELTDKYNVPGQFLEDETGKRYPAKPVLAIKLLKQKRKLKLLTQGFNYYWVGHRFEVDAEALLTVTPASPKLPEPDYRPYWQAFKQEALATLRPEKETPIVSEAFSATSTLHRVSSQGHTATSRVLECDEATPEPETDALYVQERMNKMASTSRQMLSLSNAHKLIKQYGISKLRKAMRVVETRHDVKNPAGLLIVILRSASRISELQNIG